MSWASDRLLVVPGRDGLAADAVWTVYDQQQQQRQLARLGVCTRARGVVVVVHV